MIPQLHLLNAISALEERDDVCDHIASIVREHFRDGSADIRLVVDGVPWDVWEAIDEREVTRYPTGPLKLEKPCHGVIIEWLPDRGEPAA